VVEFDFLGKDSIRYYNRVEVEKRVFKNLQLFMENKQDGDDLFDRLNVNISLLSLVITDCNVDISLLSRVRLSLTNNKLN